MKTNIMKILRDFLLSFFSKENFYTFLLLKRKITMNLKNYCLIAVWIFKQSLNKILHYDVKIRFILYRIKLPE